MTIAEIERELETSDGEQRCRVCRCTDWEACPGGCVWVEDDLCSRCEEQAYG